MVSDSADFSYIWQLCQQCIQVVMEVFGRGNVPPEWYGALQAVMDLSFDLSAYSTEKSPHGVGCPDKHWERILEAMLCGVLRQSQLQSTVSSGATEPASGTGNLGQDGEPMDAADEAGAADEEHESTAANQLVQDSRPSAGNDDVKASASQLSCLIFMAGHFALRMVIFLESAQNLLKKKRTATEDARLADKRDKKMEKAAAAEKPKKGKKSKGKEEEDDAKEKEDDEAEAAGMGQAGQEERESEHFAEMIETRILYNTKSALSRCRPLILKGLIDPHQRTNPVIRRVSAISLCKFMTVSKRFCQEHLQLLFSVLFPKAKDGSLLSSTAAEAESAANDSATQASGAGALLEDLTLRQSLLVAVGDLLFRHPNVVEPWTDRLYTALGAPSGGSPESVARAVDLRLTALLVLTHLVLNDMMKPRAVFLTRALWLTACPHESTSRVARILFQELSKRSTAVIYNLLPQIIAELADQKEGSKSEEATSSAEERVSWIMQFVEKEKHVEGLIEKLTVRLEVASDIKGMGKDGIKTKEGDAEEEGEEGDDTVESKLPLGAEGMLETVSCLAHALGSMNYSDRCIVRLHDVIVIRKGLNTAISYHPVVRECLLSIVEKTRKPNFGKKGAEDQGAAPEPAEGAAAGNGRAEKATAAASKAIDEIEQVINTLGKGKKKGGEAMECDAPAENPVEAIPTPQARAVLPVQQDDKKKGKAGKRKAEEGEVEAGFEDETAAKRGRGRKAVPSAATSAPATSLGDRMVAPAAPAVEKVKSGGEELRAALQAQKAAKKAKGKGKGKSRSAGNKVDDDDA